MEARSQLRHRPTSWCFFYFTIRDLPPLMILPLIMFNRINS